MTDASPTKWYTWQNMPKSIIYVSGADKLIQTGSDGCTVEFHGGAPGCVYGADFTGNYAKLIVAPLRQSGDNLIVAHRVQVRCKPDHAWCMSPGADAYDFSKIIEALNAAPMPDPESHALFKKNKKESPFTEKNDWLPIPGCTPHASNAEPMTNQLVHVKFGKGATAWRLLRSRGIGDNSLELGPTGEGVSVLRTRSCCVDLRPHLGKWEWRAAGGAVLTGSCVYRNVLNKIHKKLAKYAAVSDPVSDPAMARLNARDEAVLDLAAQAKLAAKASAEAKEEEHPWLPMPGVLRHGDVTWVTALRTCVVVHFMDTKGKTPVLSNGGTRYEVTVGELKTGECHIHSGRVDIRKNDSGTGWEWRESDPRPSTWFAPLVAKMKEACELRRAVAHSLSLPPGWSEPPATYIKDTSVAPKPEDEWIPLNAFIKKSLGQEAFEAMERMVTLYINIPTNINERPNMLPVQPTDPIPTRLSSDFITNAKELMTVSGLRVGGVGTGLMHQYDYMMIKLRPTIFCDWLQVVVQPVRGTTAPMPHLKAVAAVLDCYGAKTKPIEPKP